MPSHAHTHTSVHTRVHAHTHTPLGDDTAPQPCATSPAQGVTPCTPALHCCPCPGGDSPGQRGCPSTAACSQRRPQQGLCPGGCPNAPQPLQSHRPRQHGDWASKTSSRRWPRRRHGHGPSVGTASPIPGGGRASCEGGCLAQAAWDRPVCAGLEVWGPRSPAPSGQAGRTRAWGGGAGSSLPARLPSAPQPSARHPLAKGGTGRGQPACQVRRALTPSPREAEGWGDLRGRQERGCSVQTGRVGLPALSILPSQSG